MAFLLLPVITLRSQSLCTGSGQTPSSAINICSREPYVINAIPQCGTLNVPGCSDNFSYQDRNPIWFKLACYVSGSLGFTIFPADNMDNYDWQLFDISNRNPPDVFTDGSLFVASNYSTEPGETGASSDGLNEMICYGLYDRFSKMPQIIQGRQYLLMVSNREGTPNGFTLAVDGGTASITDPVEPRLQSAIQSCDGSRVIVKLNRPVRCNSISPDGSEFAISGGYTITSASSAACGLHPFTDTVVLTLNAPLPLGAYTITILNGTDGNTALDACLRHVPAGQQIPLVVSPPQPTLMDSIARPECSPARLRLQFKRAINCNSIAANGSDFIITGPQPVMISSISTSCNSGAPPRPSNSYYIDLVLTAPILTGGSYRITLVRGDDGTTLLDECGRETPEGGSLLFDLPDGVVADFTYDIRQSCQENLVSFLHPGGGSITNWDWNFGSTGTSTQQNPVQVFGATGKYNIRLVVSNGTCTDTATADFNMDNEVIASFDAPKVICPGDFLRVTNHTKGKVDVWTWNFGDGNNSNAHTPVSFVYPDNGLEATYTLQLIAHNSELNCNDTATQLIKVLSECQIAVPSAFTPNGDGLNDFLYPLNAAKAEGLEFRVFNRYGQVVFLTQDWTRKWDGTLNGKRLDTGVYIWMLSYTHKATKKKTFLRGTTLLLR